MAQQKKQQQDMSIETEICHNCKREVPQQNYLMHVAHCARNMTVCPVCGDAVPKAHLKEHRQKEHALVECPACKCKVQAGALEHHRATSCGRRTAACEFCELELPHEDLQEHEPYCGARTERCEECGELVMFRYKKLHLDSNHGFLKLNDEPGPVASWEQPLNNLRPLSSALQQQQQPVSAAEREAAARKAREIEGDGRRSSSGAAEPPPRDAPRTFVPAYDASEDLRAKVKLVRHDLNNIKQTYLVQGEERVRQLRDQARARAPDLPATNKTPRQRFTTNLVPYEKNKSYQVNALPDDERAIAVGQVPQPLLPLGAAPRGYFNYLGAREDPPPTVTPLRLTNGADKKAATSKIGVGTQTGARTSTGGSTAPKAHNSTGAVPRSNRKKGPAPAVPSSPTKGKAPKPPSTVTTERDEVTLPCEFCEKMVPAEQLVMHETACRPDLASVQVGGVSDKREIHVSPGGGATAPLTTPTTPEDQLPCEFCCNLYPASRLLGHQALCDA